MKFRILLLIGLIILVGSATREQGVRTLASHYMHDVNRDTLTRSDSVMLHDIKIADKDFSFAELARIINTCCTKYSGSIDISNALTKWLREDHPIYQGRSATEVDRLRGFLLSSLSKFPPNEDLYGYVRAEFLFGGHVYNVAAAAVTARIFPEKSEELIKLMSPYLQATYLDEWVDLSTPYPIYPYVHPTKARYEIIQTLKIYGESAYPAVKLLDDLHAPESFAVYAQDSILFAKSKDAADYIRELTPPCCRKDVETGSSDINIKVIEKKNRKNISAKNLVLQDQEAREVRFDDLRGRPFVLAFFYTQCSNPLKCASTVNRLADLQGLFNNSSQGNKVGIYGITYDPDFDDPSTLKKYGEMYGLSFAKNVKFLRAVDNSDEEFNSQLKLRVNYGGGTVNQHGIQLFLFDKKGRLAGIVDNERWSVEEVKRSMENLIKE